jgi:hypothetical protein
MGTALSHCCSSDNLRHWYSTRATEPTTRWSGLGCWHHTPKACTRSPHVPWQFTRRACAIRHAWETHWQSTSSFDYLQVKNAQKRLLFLHNQHGNVWCIQVLASIFEGTKYTYAKSRVGGGENKLKKAYVIRKTYEPSLNLLDATFFIQQKEISALKKVYFSSRITFSFYFCVLQEIPHYLDA